MALCGAGNSGDMAAQAIEAQGGKSGCGIRKLILWAANRRPPRRNKSGVNADFGRAHPTIWGLHSTVSGGKQLARVALTPQSQARPLRYPALSRWVMLR